MSREIFKSNRYFIVSDIAVSHGQFLLRSNKNEVNTTNIDIIFFDTTYIQIFTMLNGICIRLAAANKTVKYRSVEKYLSYDNKKLFEIESGDEKYYLAASFLRVYENELEFNETSLGVLQYKGRDREIAASR